MRFESKALLHLQCADCVIRILSYYSEQKLACAPYARLTVEGDQAAFLGSFTSVSLSSPKQVLFSGVVLSVTFDKTRYQSQLILGLPPAFSHTIQTQYFASCTLEKIVATLLPPNIRLDYQAKAVWVESARQGDESSFSFVQSLLKSRGLGFVFHHAAHGLVLQVFEQCFKSKRLMPESVLCVKSQGDTIKATIAPGAVQLLDAYQQCFVIAIRCEYRDKYLRCEAIFSRINFQVQSSRSNTARSEKVFAQNAQYSVFGSAQSLKAYPYQTGAKPLGFYVRLPYFHHCSPELFNLDKAKVFVDSIFPLSQALILAAVTSSSPPCAFSFQGKQLSWCQQKNSLHTSAKTLLWTVKNSLCVKASSALFLSKQSMGIKAKTIRLAAGQRIVLRCGNSCVSFCESSIEIMSDRLCLN